MIYLNHETIIADPWDLKLWRDGRWGAADEILPTQTFRRWKYRGPAMLSMLLNNYQLTDGAQTGLKVLEQSL